MLRNLSGGFRSVLLRKRAPLVSPGGLAFSSGELSCNARPRHFSSQRHLFHNQPVGGAAAGGKAAAPKESPRAPPAPFATKLNIRRAEAWLGDWRSSVAGFGPYQLKLKDELTRHGSLLNAARPLQKMNKWRVTSEALL